jgi:flagellar hook-associated protein 2
MMQLEAAADANVVIDGFPVTSSSNTISDAIDGVTLNLASAKPGTMLDFSVEYDPDGAKTSVQGFVTAYNKLIDTVAELTRYNADTGCCVVARRCHGTHPRPVATEISLLGPSVFTYLLRSASPPKSTASWLSTPRNSARYRCRFDAVGALFSGTNGLARRLETIAEASLSSGSTITTRENSLKSTLKGITSQRETLDERIEKVRIRLQDQFNAMDRLLGQLKNTSAFLTQQLS